MTSGYDNLYGIFCYCLNQGMEEVKRQFGQHIAVEPEWEAGFSLQIQLRHILAMFQDWCSSDVSCHSLCFSNLRVILQLTSLSIHSPSPIPPPQDEILLLSFKECHNVLMQCNNQPFHLEPTNYYMCKQILHVRPFKVSQEPVSIHLPLSRLLAGM